MGLSSTDVTFLRFTAQDLPYAEAIVDLVLDAYEGDLLKGLAVMASNREVSPHLVHAFHSFTLQLDSGWLLLVYRNGGRDFWTVQQVCPTCSKLTLDPPARHHSRWEKMAKRTDGREVLSCARCGLALAPPDTGVYFTFFSGETAGFLTEVVEEQVLEQDHDRSVLSAAAEVAELRRLLFRLIAASGNTVYWAHSDRLALLLEEGKG